METFQHRLWPSPLSLRGRWTLGPDPAQDRVIYQLELPWKNNTPFVSCIPAGRYLLKKEFLAGHPHMHEKFGRWFDWLPMYDGVPGRSACFVHLANKPADILGCTAPGMSMSLDWVGDSKDALALIMALMEKTIASGDQVYATITDDYLAKP